jgi:hypothetical protein
MRDDRAHREEQARLENGGTAEVIPLTLAWSFSTTKETPKKVYAVLTSPTPEDLAAVDNAKIGTHFRGMDPLTSGNKDWLRAHGYNV